MPLVLEEVVAALAQRVPEQDGALREVDAVSRAASPELRQRRRIRRQLGDLLTSLLRPLVEAPERQPRAGLQHLRDLRGHVVALGKLSSQIGHGVFLS